MTFRDEITDAPQRKTAIALLLAAMIVFSALSIAEEPVRGIPSFKVPEGFTVEVAAPSEISSYPMFMNFDHKGRMFIAESSGKNTKGKDTPKFPECMILQIEDTNGDGVFDKRTVFADKLSLPMGVLWYRGAVYVGSPPDFFRFEDTDGDGVADKREALLTGWNVLNTASLHGPYLGPDGYLYLTHGRHGYDITSKEGVHYEGKASRIWRCKPDGTQLERFCGGGFDNPVELTWADNGDLFGTMTYFTDPMNGQRDALMHWVEGGVYPKMEASTAEFIRTGDLMPVLTKFARIAPSGLTTYRGANFGAEYQGNLFSAQFNPHRVQRHVLTPDGATYKCADSDFLTSTDPDFHPTDVVVDADGSLLVSDTGGWYVDACPVSRVAKPEIRGTIYRIKKKDAPKVDDPWGVSLNIDKADGKQLVALLSDARPRVREFALERVIQAGQGGENVTAPLQELLASASPRSTLAAQALGQIGTPDTLKTLRTSGLASTSPAVRATSAYLAGTMHDKDALPALIAMLRDENLNVRREVVASLGRLKAVEAVPAIIAACAQPIDRFVEHATIFALITINEQAPLVAALSNPDAETRKCALIALDQLKSDNLTADHAIAFLNDNSEDLRKTGLWVASRHPEWSGSVLALIDQKVNAPDFAPETAASLRTVLLAYAQDEQVQAFMARVAADDAAPAPRREFMLETIEKAALNPLPDGLVQAVGKALQSGDETIRYRAATLIGTRKITSFDDQLLAIADNATENVTLRLSALGTTEVRHPELSDSRYQFLLANLATEADPAIRLAGSRVIAGAKLTNAQLSILADQQLPKADAMTFPGLLESFKNSNDEAVGLALVKSLSTAAIKPSLIPGGLDNLLKPYPDSVKQAAAPLRAQVEAEEKERLAKLATIEPLIGTGDVGRGRQIFFSEKQACFTCHAVGKEGGNLGPDLTTIGAIRSGHDLLEAILFPNASFVPGYEPMRVSAKDPDFGGNVDYVGVIGEQTADAITLRQNAKDSIRIARKDIVSMDQAPNSVMPQGLDAAMSQEQLLDLLAFMQSLNNEVWLLPEIRGTNKEH